MSRASEYHQHQLLEPTEVLITGRTDKVESSMHAKNRFEREERKRLGNEEYERLCREFAEWERVKHL